MDPQAKVVKGWEPIMPTFKGQTDEDDIYELIAFIKGLGPGQTPKRVEDFPPPLTTPQIDEPKKESTP